MSPTSKCRVDENAKNGTRVKGKYCFKITKKWMVYFFVPFIAFSANL